MLLLLNVAWQRPWNSLSAVVAALNVSDACTCTDVAAERRALICLSWVDSVWRWSTSLLSASRPSHLKNRTDKSYFKCCQTWQTIKTRIWSKWASVVCFFPLLLLVHQIWNVKWRLCPKSKGASTAHTQNWHPVRIELLSQESVLCLGQEALQGARHILEVMLLLPQLDITGAVGELLQELGYSTGVSRLLVDPVMAQAWLPRKRHTNKWANWKLAPLLLQAVTL